MVLKLAFEKLSTPQRVVLKALYGLPLTSDAEKRAWAIFQENCEYDELGFVTKHWPVPYIPEEFKSAVAVFGRRSGKTDKFLAFVLLYEAAFGGHAQWASTKQEVVCYLVSQNQTVARKNLNFVRSLILDSKLAQRTQTIDLIDSVGFSNGVTIEPASPSVKAQRGIAVPVVALDEVGFWYTDADAANPDIEVERALRPAMGQFPHRKQIICSTPWAKEGLLWEYYNAGTRGTKLPPGINAKKFGRTLVLHSSTAAIENPLFLDRQFFDEEFAADYDGYQREYLGRFTDSVSGFLSPALLRGAVEVGVAERPPEPAEKGFHYVAAMDPAFRNDSFAFTILHLDPAKGLVVDFVKEWKPTEGVVLNPAIILDTIRVWAAQYRVDVIYTDQHHFESLEQLALDRGLVVERVPFSSGSKQGIYGSLQQIVNQKRIVLLDGELNPDAHTMLVQLMRLEKKLTGMGNVQIGAPRGQHDDMATVIAIGVFKALWLLPEQLSERSETKAKTHVEMGMDSIRSRNSQKHMSDSYGGLWEGL